MKDGKRIPIVGGTGALGYGLALRWARGGNDVVIGSRDPSRAQEAADRIRHEAPGSQVRGVENREAVRQGPIIFLTVPFAAQAETLTSIRSDLSEGQLLVDCTVPLATAAGGKPTRTVGVWQGSAAQQAQELVPDGVTVVSALHTVSAAALAQDALLDEDILICGDLKRYKAGVARLIEEIDGLRAVNAGALEMARIVEGLTPMLISVNTRYKVHAGIRITGLPDESDW
jgi:NADPH-dependent F420 reductase